MNSTICSTATLIGIHVVVGGWKSHVFAIQNPKAAIILCGKIHVSRFKAIHIVAFLCSRFIIGASSN